MWGDKLLSPRQELGRTTATEGGKEIQSSSGLDIQTFFHIFSCARCPKCSASCIPSIRRWAITSGHTCQGRRLWLFPGMHNLHQDCLLYQLPSVLQMNSIYQFLSHCGCKPSFYQSLRLGHKLGWSLSTRGHQRPVALPHSPRGVLQLQPAGYSWRSLTTL